MFSRGLRKDSAHNALDSRWLSRLWSTERDQSPGRAYCEEEEIDQSTLPRDLVKPLKLTSYRLGTLQTRLLRRSFAVNGCVEI